MRVDVFDFALPPERIALAPAWPRESARMLTVGADGALGDLRIDDLPSASAARRRPRRQRHPRHRGAADGRADARRSRAPDRGHADPRESMRAVGAPSRGPPRKSTSASGSASAQAEKATPACSARSTPKSRRKGEGGEVLLAFALRRRRARRGDRPLRRHAAAALYRRAPARPTRATGGTTRPCSPPSRAPSPRRPPACISRPSSSRAIEARGVALHRLTLHVGAGTFLPVKVEDTRDHAMHAEWGRIDAATATR